MIFSYFLNLRWLNSPQHNSYLGVSIRNADIHSNHDENSNGDTKVSNQTTDLVRQQAPHGQNHVGPTTSFSKHIESRFYRAGEVVTILEMTEEVCNQEATKHQAHRQQGGIGVGPMRLRLVSGDVAMLIDLSVLDEDRVEGVVQCVVQMIVVQNQRVGFEDLSKRR